jgi:hypothetical protein
MFVACIVRERRSVSNYLRFTHAWLLVRERKKRKFTLVIDLKVFHRILTHGTRLLYRTFEHLIAMFPPLVPQIYTFNLGTGIHTSPITSKWNSCTSFPYFLNHLAHKIQAPKAPATTNAAPDPTFEPAPAAGDAVADGPGVAFAATLLPARKLVAEAAGLVAGSATPLGQCQWLPWGSHVDAVTACSWSSSSSECE